MHTFKCRYILTLIMSLVLILCFVICVNAGDGDTYVKANGDCLLKLKVVDGAVPVYDESTGFVLGIPAGAKVTDELFTAPEGYTLSYEKAVSGNIGTGTVIKLSNDNSVLSYTAVVYGDLDGDSVIDVLDITLVDRVINKTDELINEVQKEAALVANDEEIGILDYSVAVNNAISATDNTKNRKMPLSLCTVNADTPDVTYNGSAFTPAVTVTDGGNALDASDYKVEYINNVNAGTATVTISGTNNYVGNVSKTFTINKAHIADTSLLFDSVMYANSTTKRTAAVTMNSAFKPFVTIKYNGSETAPSSAGIYLVTADISNANDNYDHETKTVNLGSIFIAPATVSGSFKVSVDNTAKTMTVAIVKPNAENTALASAFENWLNSAYTLCINNSPVSESVAAKLPQRNFDVYTNQSGTEEKPLTVTATSGLLGCYLPDDNTLWTNDKASNSVSVSLSGVENTSFNLVFCQDQSLITTAKATYLLTQSAGARTQRTETPTAQNMACYVKRLNGVNNMHMAINKSSSQLLYSLGGTGLKTIMVGYIDAIYCQTSTTNTFPAVDSSNVTMLYDDSNKSYAQYGTSDATGLVDVVNDMLKDFGISGLSGTSALSSLNNKYGYLNYLCVKNDNGLRYQIPFYVDFLTYNAATDAHKSITCSAATNGTVTTSVKTTAATVEVKTSAWQYLMGGTKYTVYPNLCMALGEPFTVTAAPSSGFKTDSVSVVSNGAELTKDEYGLYYATTSDITVSATFVAK